MDIKESFRVPEGYFENFSQKIMVQLTERECKPAIKSYVTELLPRIAVSIAVLVVFTTSWFVADSINDTYQTDTVSNAVYEGVYTIDELEELAMIDHQDVYMMLNE